MAIFYTDSGSFNTLEVTGSTILSGSLIISGAAQFGSGGLTGSLFGTSSVATSASYALTASYAENATSTPAFPFGGSAVITGSLLISQSIQGVPALQVSGGIRFNTGSTLVYTATDGLYVENNGQGLSLKVGAGAFLGTHTSDNLNFLVGGVNRAFFTSNGLIPNSDVSYDLGASGGFRWNTLHIGTVSASGIVGTTISASTALTASNVQLRGLTDTTSTNKVLVLDTVTNKIFTTASVGTGGGPGGSAFPYTGTAVITGSLIVSGSGNTPRVTIQGSGSTVFAISGSSGPLFEVIDSASGELFTLTSASVDIFKVDNNKVVNVSGSLKVTGSTHINGPTELRGTLTVSSSNNSNPVIVSGSTDSFFELEVVNFSAGNNASSDIVVSSNNTTDAGNYIDLGINSTTYNGGLVGGPSDGYVYFTSSVGELDIGNASPGSNGNVRLFAGGPNSTNTTRVFISSSGNVGINTTTNLRNTLSVNGSISASAGITGSFTGSFSGSLDRFNPVALRITVGTTAPTSPAVNDLWVDTN